MNALEIARRYFDAWNRRDADGVLATFAEGGTYNDPLTNGPLSGQALADYTRPLWAAFPDLSFDVVTMAEHGPGRVAAQWTMRGTNAGPFMGLSPTGRAIALPGADFIEIGDGGIRKVEGYFDGRAVPTQLGLDVIVQPAAAGPFEFGTAVGVQSGKKTKPGAFSITIVHTRSADDVQRIRAYTREIAPKMQGLKGFIGLVTASLGNRMVTVAAWESPDDPRQMGQIGVHEEAVAAFFGPELTSGGMFGIWVPERMGPFWVRCPSCARMTDSRGPSGRCSCGAALPEPKPYW